MFSSKVSQKTVQFIEHMKKYFELDDSEITVKSNSPNINTIEIIMNHNLLDENENYRLTKFLELHYAEKKMDLNAASNVVVWIMSSNRLDSAIRMLKSLESVKGQELRTMNQ